MILLKSIKIKISIDNWFKILFSSESNPKREVQNEMKGNWESDLIKLKPEHLAQWLAGLVLGKFDKNIHIHTYNFDSLLLFIGKMAISWTQPSKASSLQLYSPQNSKPTTIILILKNMKIKMKVQRYRSGLGLNVWLLRISEWIRTSQLLIIKLYKKIVMLYFGFWMIFISFLLWSFRFKLKPLNLYTQGSVSPNHLVFFLLCLAASWDTQLSLNRTLDGWGIEALVFDTNLQVLHKKSWKIETKSE